MFLHADFVHLGVNCVWLLAFGPIVARRYGTMLFLLFFYRMRRGWSGDVSCLRLGLAAGVIGHQAQYQGSWRPASECILAGIVPGSPNGADFSSPVLLFTGFWLGTNLLFRSSGVRSGR